MVPVIEHKPTFCRICEPLCGMVATVEDGRLVALRPDKEHPLSAGFACQKGIAFTEVQNDPDRVTTPLRRGPNGFEPVTWDDAMSDIAARLSAVLRRDGSGGVGWYMGNPGAFSYAHTFAALLFMKGLGRHGHYFTASSQDTNSRLIASQLLYGVPTSVPIPDLTRTDLLVMMGANPVVSHGSFLTAPRIKDRMQDIVKRGGRVVVVDPRRTETAVAFEWLGIVPDSDSFLLLSLLQVMFTERLVDVDRVSRVADGVDWLRTLSEPFTPEATAAQTGIDPATVRALARDLVRTPRAAIYGQTRHVRGPLRHAHHLSDRRGQFGCGKPRRSGRFGLQLDADRRPEMAEHHDGRRDAALAAAKAVTRQRDSQRDRFRAGRDDGQGDHDAGRSPDQGDVRLGGQPRAVGTERR